MLTQSPSFLDETKKAIALALHEAGQTDQEIGLQLRVPPANIADWRRREGLPENKPPMSDKVAAYMARAEAAPQQRAPYTAVASPPPPVTPPPSVATAAYSAPVARPQIQSRRAEPELLVGVGVNPPAELALEIGADAEGDMALVDLGELLATRLLVQGNSGSGKSHLLRKLIEASADRVQQVIIDPEGDFVSLSEAFSHTVFHAKDYSCGQLASVAGKVRQHRASVVLSLADLDLEDQMASTSSFLNGLFNVGSEHWHPCLVFLDEAQIFAPSSNATIDVGGSTRAASVGAVTDLMCRGRKRGLSGVIATQRLAKLSTNVAAEAANFLMGRTFFDADIARACDLLGLKPAQGAQIGDLQRGEFIGFGAAIARKPLKIIVGDTVTRSPNETPALTPLPAYAAEDMGNLLAPDQEDEAPTEKAKPRLKVVA